MEKKEKKKDEKPKQEEVKFLIVSPGEVISENSQDFLRGHGVYEKNGKLISSVCGVVERVNKLITVIPPKSLYRGEVGDVIVGRITSVESGMWKVDIKSRGDAILYLASINFGGMQKRRTFEDNSKMREIFIEKDLIVAEVQSFIGGGQSNICSLQTRSNTYGLLSNGISVSVNCELIKHCKRHFFNFTEAGCQIILGRNGIIWISSLIDKSEEKNNLDNKESNDGSNDDYNNNCIINYQKSQKYFKIEKNKRENICRIRNSILCLEKEDIQIFPDTICDVYTNSLKTYSTIPLKEMLSNSSLICQNAKKMVSDLNLLEYQERLKKTDDEFTFDL